MAVVVATCLTERIFATPRLSGGGRVVGYLLFGILLADSARAQENERYQYVATPVLEFKYPGEPAMHMPTSVAVASDGTVYVADGVNDRILVFGATGEFLREISAAGGQPLSQPVSVKVDRTDRLWIADTGNRRVVALTADGTPATEIRLPERGRQAPPDISDIAISFDGKTRWLADNENHQLARLDAESGELSYYGRVGEALGQFYHPFAIAINARGDVFVTEVLNGRVQILSATGRVVGSLGTYGPDLGNLYRPKGIALDADGNAWVVDGTMGVVQVFRPTGILIDVVRSGAGNPLKLDTPFGIALDTSGDLYLTELVPNRVRKFAVEFDPAGRPLNLAGRTRAAATIQPRACTACHAEWLEPLARGESTPVMSPPETTREHPAVTRPRTCLSCHDGSVVDSRRRVWLEHGHRSGITPPASMTVPEHLPLAGGAIVCRTCHSAHTRGGSGDVLKDTVFLRVEHDPAELCTACHAEYGRGRGAGMHPLGDMPIDLPRELVHVGTEAAGARVTCLACHTGHGARHEALLVASPDSNELCLACHRQLAPALFGEATRSAHARLATLQAGQPAVAEGFATRLGPSGELLCTTCHAPHRGRSQHLLAFDPAQQDVCVSCHIKQRRVAGSVHDLRTNFPQTRNILGVTAKAGGVCSSCHTAHRFARPTEGTALDSTGHCIACHASGQLAASKRLGDINHPALKCVVCHDPHEAEQASFLRQPPEELCLECHDHGEEMTGGHVFEDQPDLVNARGQKLGDVGTCLICHSMHHGVAKPLWAASLEPLQRDEEKCTVCHRTGGMAQAKPKKPFNHTLTCQSCHNPHADAEANPALLKVDPPAQDLCLQCHDEHETVQDGPHDFRRNPQAWPKASLAKGDRCLACHQPHADEEARLFTNGLADGVTGPDAACLACHPQAAWRTDSDVAAIHPRDAEDLDPDDEYLPLVPLGDEDEEYAIGCRTCHNPHRGEGPPGFLVRAEEEDPTAGLCLECHDTAEHIAMTGHSAESLRRAGLDAEACKPCHGVHANPSAAERLMWTAKTAPDARSPADRRCLGCHSKSGPARPPAIATHPDVPISAGIAAAVPAGLPLFNADGEEDPRGRIACLTCHLPHGRSLGHKAPDADSLTPELRRAMRLEVRPFVVPSLCNVCHGESGRWRFLYFHDPQRRKGPAGRGR
ncbi:MAG: cytochrome c3 family protein [Phycisphaerae bacterium]